MTKQQELTAILSSPPPPSLRELVKDHGIIAGDEEGNVIVSISQSIDADEIVILSDAVQAEYEEHAKHGLLTGDSVLAIGLKQKELDVAAGKAPTFMKWTYPQNAR